MSYQRVQDHLERLNMHAALQSRDHILEPAQQQEQLAVEVLDELLGQELAARFERRIKVNFKFSGLPMLKRMARSLATVFLETPTVRLIAAMLIPSTINPMISARFSLLKGYSY